MEDFSYHNIGTNCARYFYLFIDGMYLNIKINNKKLIKRTK